MTRRRALLLALALAGSCKAPTAPGYTGACTLAVPRAQPFVVLCYNDCPPHAESFAAEADMAFASVARCGTSTAVRAGPAPTLTVTR